MELDITMARIGIATWNFQGAELAPKLRMFAEMGYTAVSINNRLLDTITAQEEAEANLILDEFDLIVTAHGGFVDEDVDMRRTERILQWHEHTGRIACNSYDVPSVVAADGIKRAVPEQISDTLAKLLDTFAGTGIRVLLEDCPLNSEIAQHFDGWTEKHPHLGTLADLGHMNMRLRERRSDNPLKPGAVEGYLKALPWEIAELHIHSNDGSKDQHAPPYAPNADLASAAVVLREMGFDGISTIELVPAWCGLPEEEIIPACRKSLKYWRGLMNGETSCT